MSTGGTSPIHSVVVSQGSGEDMMTVAQDMGGSGDAGNGFGIKTDMGIDSLEGHPNLKAGDYMWELHASDDMATPTQVSVAWKFRVDAGPLR